MGGTILQVRVATRFGMLTRDLRKNKHAPLKIFA